MSESGVRVALAVLLRTGMASRLAAWMRLEA
jgi:hypothetical protein